MGHLRTRTYTRTHTHIRTNMRTHTREFQISKQNTSTDSDQTMKGSR